MHLVGLFKSTFLDQLTKENHESHMSDTEMAMGPPQHLLCIKSKGRIMKNEKKYGKINDPT